MTPSRGEQETLANVNRNNVASRLRHRIPFPYLLVIAVFAAIRFGWLLFSFAFPCVASFARTLCLRAVMADGERLERAEPGSGAGIGMASRTRLCLK